LLRGINVGGKNKLLMLFTDADCADVVTYIQSGNVVFRASLACARRIPGVISERIATRFRLRVPVILRSADELRDAASRNPWVKSGAAPGSLHVAFLADAPDKRRLAALDPHHSPGDSFTVRGREVYLWLPGGVARTKLTNAYFDSALATTSTLRNWRTVLKLVEIVEARGG
jgi:uncharacterized protein (DUF1697 family)